MEEKKVTIMVIKVDLGCYKCTKKIKKILCGTPQIQSQIYDEKANTVTVTVVCCSPEKIKKKICSKGGDTIKGIELRDPQKPKEKPKEPEKPKEKPKEPEKPKEKPKEAEKPKEKPKEPEKPKEKPKEPEKPKDKPKEPEKPKETEKPKNKEEGAKPKAAEPAQKAPEPKPVGLAPAPLQVIVGGQEWHQGYFGYEGFGPVAAAQPEPTYVAYGRPVYDSWGGGASVYYGGCGRGCCVGRCDCVREENPPPCSIM